MVVISDESAIRAVCWYLQRNDVYLLRGSGELDYGLRYKDSSGKLLDIPSAVDLIDLNYGPWHTAEDTLDKLSPRSLQIVGEVVLESISEIDRQR